MLLSSGCYYSHLARGQIELLLARRPIDEVLADPATQPDTAALLTLADAARHFAAELGLDVGDQYTSFVDWPGDRIVTTLARSRPDAVEAVPFWFPVLGELPYKGYFDRARAEAEAERLETREGFDVCVSAVSAYSTLGWVDDPVTAPMLSRGPAYLVETILHELVHATAYLPDDPDFSESVAQFIGEEAAIRFFAANASHRRILQARLEGAGFEWPAPDRLRNRTADRRQLGRFFSATRDELAAFYAARAGAGPSDEALHTSADSLRASARQRLAALPFAELDAERIARLARLGNACLALRGTYVDDGPRHAAVLDSLGGDLPALIKRLRAAAKTSRPADEFYVPLVAGKIAGTVSENRKAKTLAPATTPPH